MTAAEPAPWAEAVEARRASRDERVDGASIGVRRSVGVLATPCLPAAIAAMSAEAMQCLEQSKVAHAVVDNRDSGIAPDWSRPQASRELIWQKYCFSSDGSIDGQTIAGSINLISGIGGLGGENVQLRSPYKVRNLPTTRAVYRDRLSEP